jgi:hypothetical protein
MRLIVVLGVSALALAACQKKEEKTAAATGEGAPAVVTAKPVAPPKLRAGYWTQKISSQGTTQEIRLCLDEATAARMNLWGSQTTADMCAKYAITPTAGGWAFESECGLGAGGTTVTKGVVTGDLGSSYTVKASTTTTGSQMAQANGTRDMEIAAVWAAQCPAGMKAGDMSMPGGMTINLSQIEAMQKRAGGK